MIGQELNLNAQTTSLASPNALSANDLEPEPKNEDVTKFETCPIVNALREHAERFPEHKTS